MSAGLAIPAIIILGCALLAGIVAMATRKKRALWDIFPGPVPEAGDAASDEGPVLFDGEAGLSDPDNEPHGVSGKPKLKLVGEATDEVQTDVDTARSDHQSLAEWHQRHNQTVSAWIENHQRVLGDINASGLQIDMDDRDELLAGHDELAPKMRAAIASHPSPVMRAELSAMHVAGEAAVFAVIKSDYASARRQHLVYVQYRDEWIERLRQFSEEPMSNLRAVMSATEFELEEIRTALEIALIGTEEPAEDAPGFEAPIMVQQDSEPAFDLENQPEDALEVAVGVPEDTTEDLEGGRIRRLLRRRSTTEDAG
ncbi:MAG: hypothetical protein OXN79_08805 [bacterium]|nr:hypothetical protein [bacterium]